MSELGAEIEQSQAPAQRSLDGPIAELGLFDAHTMVREERMFESGEVSVGECAQVPNSSEETVVVLVACCEK